MTRAHVVTASPNHPPPHPPPFPQPLRQRPRRRIAPHGRAHQPPPPLCSSVLLFGHSSVTASVVRAGRLLYHVISSPTKPWRSGSATRCAAEARATWPRTRPSSCRWTCVSPSPPPAAASCTCTSSGSPDCGVRLQGHRVVGPGGDEVHQFRRSPGGPTRRNVAYCTRSPPPG